MATDRTDLAARNSGDGNPSRRRIVLTGLTGALASVASRSIGSTLAADAPTFQSGRYQFTMIRPQLELPSIRLSGSKEVRLISRPFAASRCFLIFGHLGARPAEQNYRSWNGNTKAPGVAAWMSSLFRKTEAAGRR